MSLVFPDRSILDTIGPFHGTANGAIITQRIVDTRNELREWCDDGDIMICDRGFGDVIQTLTDLGYEVKSPAYLDKFQAQHNTVEASECRLMTKVRWTVESYHSQMKKWRILSDRIENQFVPKIGDIGKIISAVLNAFRDPIVNDGQDFESDLIAKIMKEQLLKTSTLLDDINHGLISSQSHWKLILMIKV